MHFEEKPAAGAAARTSISELPGDGPAFLASMGIYVFSPRGARARASATPRSSTSAATSSRRRCRDQRVQALRLPRLLGGRRDHPLLLRGQPGAVPTRCRPSTSTTSARPVYTHPRFLPATKVEDCTLESALVSEGCILVGAEIERSVIGIRSRIGHGRADPRQPGAGRRLLRDAWRRSTARRRRACRRSGIGAGDA